MHQFRNILFSPLGDAGNTEAIRSIDQLAAQTGAAVSLLGVISEPSGIQRLLHSAAFHKSVRAAQEEAMVVKLMQPGEGPEHKASTRCGRSAQVLVDAIEKNSHDLLVITSDEDSEDRATIRELMRKCPCPVWVIRRNHIHPGRILVAVNPEPEEEALSTYILETAASIASRYRGELHVIHAWQLFGESFMRSSASWHISHDETETFRREEEAYREDVLKKLLEHCDLGDPTYQVHLQSGPAAQVIREHIKSLGIDLLVMGTVARQGVAGLLMGNTAERVLDHVTCSVMALKAPVA